MGLSSATTILSTGYRPLGSCSRSAGWSAATLCLGTLRRLARCSDRSGVEVKSEVAGRLSKCTGFIMEIIGRRWTITYCFAGAIPGLALMVLAHRTGDYATVAMSAGVIITGLTVLSSFTAVRVYLSEQFPTP